MSDTSEDAHITTFSEGDSFAAYSMPGSSDFHVTFQDDHSYTATPPDSDPYFVIAPFRRDQEASKYIRADQLLLNQKFSLNMNTTCQFRSTEQDKYLSDVQRIITDIEARHYQKLVYSRIITAGRNEQSIYQIYRSLVERYTGAFVFCYYTPDGGCWMGATPESLIEDGGDRFRTVALAGTQMDRGVSLDEVTWQAKEVHEHHYLKEYIDHHLTQEGISFTEGRTQTVKAGNVVHISTEFAIDKVKPITDMANLLHPGPAICGTPQNIAQQHIQSYEDHDREDYCGYIGLVGIDDCHAIYINLRSMQIFKEVLMLYVGGGITKDSIPQDEWDETQNKSLTILSVIQNSDNQ